MHSSSQTPLSTQDLLTDQFYRWEVRGRGCAQWDQPVDLEPPFRPFIGHYVVPDQVEDDGIQETPLRRVVGKVRSLLGRSGRRADEIPEWLKEGEPNLELVNERRELVELQIRLPADLNPAADVFEQFLQAIPLCESSIAFELVGDREKLIVQLAVGDSDVNKVSAQFKALFPDATLHPVRSFLEDKWNAVDVGYMGICEFGLKNEFVLPLNLQRHLPTDPLASFCGALEHLVADELGVVQVLFQPIRYEWAESAWRAVTSNDGKPFFSNAPEITAHAKQKLAKPLFAVVVRIAGRSDSRERADELLGGLCGPMNLFGHPTTNEFFLLPPGDCTLDDHEHDLLGRLSRRSGMLLNSEELVGLVHLPSPEVRARKLKREAKRTKEPPGIAFGEGVLLGENVHEGTVTAVTLKPAHRVRHMHLIGASGTGKSTLLLNLICQDMKQGHGLAVLDPHGDLIDQILARVPPEREKDVILFDPSDEEYPIGFNVLSARSNMEKNRLASDLVGVFRRLSTSWGDQMTSVLGNAILAFLESSRGGTLADLRRFLLEPAFRKELLATVQDQNIVYYWQRQFPILKTNSIGPLLTRLDTFLRPKAIRHMVGQSADKLDFGRIMNGRKLFLAKLPQGLIGKENAFLLGALLVAKFHQMALGRQELEAAEREPFFLFIDEFQEFATPSMADILSGVRKYQLGLILAHHELRQLQGSDDLVGAVMSHPFTRVCFRLGDADAKKLADGFSFFRAADLQNLDTGEAICRMERADQDFNLRTILLPDLDSEGVEARQDRLRALSRQRYGVPRAEVEKELERSRADAGLDRQDPFATRTAQAKKEAASRKVERPNRANKAAEVTKTERATQAKAMDDSPKAESASAPPEGENRDAPEPVGLKVPSAKKEPKGREGDFRPVRPTVAQGRGRGGAQHQEIVDRIKEVAEPLGFRVKKEWRIPGGKRAADVMIKRGASPIAACQIAVTTTVDHEVGSALDCLRAGCPRILIACAEAAKRDKLEVALANCRLKAEDAKRVEIMTVTELWDYLPGLLKRATQPVSTERLSKGLRVRRKYPQLSDEEQCLHVDATYEIMAEAARRQREGEK